MTDSNPFQSILDLQTQLRKKIRDEGKEILKTELNKFLEKHPEVHTLMWAQSDNVYNDESYDFRVFGLDVLIDTKLPWAEAYYREAGDEYGDEREISRREHFHGSSTLFLKEVAKEFPDYSDTILSIKEDLYNLDNSIPRGVLEVFGNVAVKVTREGIFMADYDYGY